MKSTSSVIGKVASLHLHPPERTKPLKAVEEVEAVAASGLKGDERYFGRLSRETGQPSKRQVTLMEREVISGHAASLGMPTITPGAVRSNVETTGIDLVSLIGKEIQIGDAVLFLYEPRMPCEQMDQICQGLRKLMEDRRQGVLAQVRRSGCIKVGDSIRVL